MDVTRKNITPVEDYEIDSDGLFTAVIDGELVGPEPVIEQRNGYVETEDNVYRIR